MKDCFLMALIMIRIDIINMSKYVYVLYLERHTYYVGSSNNPKSRIEQHFKNDGTKWTKLHKPLEVISIIEGDELVEETTTLDYMHKYGINNVRGGSFTTLTIFMSLIQ
jgi:predicted GIY-YIG superfamily endonuclease